MDTRFRNLRQDVGIPIRHGMLNFIMTARIHCEGAVIAYSSIIIQTSLYDEVMVNCEHLF